MRFEFLPFADTNTISHLIVAKIANLSIKVKLYLLLLFSIGLA